MSIPLSASQVLDREFLPLRAKLLEIGAMLDRMDRAADSMDDRGPTGGDAANGDAANGDATNGDATNGAAANGAPTKKPAGSGTVNSDPRLQRIRRAWAILQSHQPDRAEQLQLLFSLPYDDHWRAKFGV
jgi:hypothetical protein